MRQLLILLFIVFCQISAVKAEYDVNVLHSDLNAPWALAQLPDGGWLVTERSGNLVLLEDTEKKVIRGVPEVFYAGQGGLLDVALHPDFALHNQVFLSYAKGNADKNALSLYKAELNLDTLTLESGADIFTVSPQKDTPVHYAGRIAFLSDGSLLLTSGDGFDYREAAQLKHSQLGKILRMNDEGEALRDNPFHSDSDAAYVWSLGHRNPQAILVEASTNTVFSHEHGPAGGDEINIIEKGKNYGWPVITNGKDYSGANISPFTEYPGMQQPLLDWTPSIAPSDMILYRGQKFPELTGHLLATTLKTRELRVVKLVQNTVTEQVSLLTGLQERFRAIEQDEQGNIVLLTDSGKVLQLTRN